MTKASASTLPDLGCACASIRRAARLVTQLYGREIGHGLEAGQFSLLSVLKRRPGVSQTPLGRALGLDKTTLSRNLRLMQKNGWVEPVMTDDRRERGYRLTAAGERLLEAASPGWRRAQEKLRVALARPDPKRAAAWNSMIEAFDLAANTAHEILSGDAENESK